MKDLNEDEISRQKETDRKWEQWERDGANVNDPFFLLHASDEQMEAAGMMRTIKEKNEEIRQTIQLAQERGVPLTSDSATLLSPQHPSEGEDFRGPQGWEGDVQSQEGTMPWMDRLDRGVTRMDSRQDQAKADLRRQEGERQQEGRRGRRGRSSKF